MRATRIGFAGVVAIVSILFLGKTSADARSMAPTQPATSRSAPIRILYMGDQAGLPSYGPHVLLQELAAGVDIPLYVEAAVVGKSSLARGQLDAPVKLIRDGKWDLVVVACDNGLALSDPKKLEAGLKVLCDAATASFVQPLLCVPPAYAYCADKQPAIDTVYAAIRKSLEVESIPVGDAWERVRDANPRMLLHMPDLVTATQAGSYLTASVLFAAIFNRSPEGLPNKIEVDGKAVVQLEKVDVKVLQKVAAETCAVSDKKFPNSGTRPVVFICDATGTMMGLKFKLLQREVLTKLHAMKETDHFNLIFFSGQDVKQFAGRPLSATKANVADAKEFMMTINVFGKGTDPGPALRRVRINHVIQIELIGDGQFDNVVSYEEIVPLIKRTFFRHDLIINTTCIMSEEEEGRSIMKEIAEQFRGRFKYIDEKSL